MPNSWCQYNAFTPPCGVGCCLFFIAAPIVCRDLCLTLVLLCSIKSLVLQYISKDERVGCYTLSVFLLLCGCKWSVSLLMVLWVGRQCMIVVILTYFLDVCGDTEGTNDASGMRRDFYSVVPEASTRVK